MYNKSNIKQDKFRTKCMGDLKVEVFLDGFC